MNRNHIARIAALVTALLPLAAINTAFAQSKMEGKMEPKMGGKMGKMDKMAKGPVYVCKECKTYMSADAAKKVGYKDAMGHKMAKMAKAPASFMEAKMGGKMDKMGGKMEPKMGGKMDKKMEGKPDGKM